MIYIIAWFVIGFGTMIMCIVNDYLNYRNPYSISELLGMFLFGCLGPIITFIVMVVEIQDKGYFEKIGNFFNKKRFVK